MLFCRLALQGGGGSDSKSIALEFINNEFCS